MNSLGQIVLIVIKKGIRSLQQDFDFFGLQHEKFCFAKNLSSEWEPISFVATTVDINLQMSNKRTEAMQNKFYKYSVIYRQEDLINKNINMQKILINDYWSEQDMSLFSDMVFIQTKSQTGDVKIP